MLSKEPKVRAIYILYLCLYYYIITYIIPILEFIEVGKRGSALEVLNDVIRSRKHRQKWTDVHEKIMLQYCELCVELQRSSYAKDGLYHYRTICKEVAPNSFEKVISAFLKSAEKRASDAREQSEATVLQEVEDLDAVVTPER